MTTTTMTISYEPAMIQVTDGRGEIAGATVTSPSWDRPYGIIPVEGDSLDCWAGDLADRVYEAPEADRDQIIEALIEAARAGALGREGSIEVEIGEGE